MKFLGDMGVSLTTVIALRAADHDAIHLRDEGLIRLPDPMIMAKALAESRIVRSSPEKEQRHEAAYNMKDVWTFTQSLAERGTCRESGPRDRARDPCGKDLARLPRFPADSTA